VEQFSLLTSSWLRSVHTVGDNVPRRISMPGGFDLLVDTDSLHAVGIANTRLPVDTKGGPDRITQLMHGDLRRFGVDVSAMPNVSIDAVVDSLTALNVVRRFASSLMGFSNASLLHVWKQALECSAAVMVRSGEWEVKLSGSPLASVARWHGHDDRTTWLPWNNELRVHVEIQ
jgi:hypothetical protein